MKRQRDGTGLRRTAALVSALALLFHIAVMALGAGQPPSLGSGITRAHAHHDMKDGASAPAEAAGHKAPCCILSVCPGLPFPPLVYALDFLPDRTAGASVHWAGRAMTVSRLPLLPPVGARAPPMLA